MNSFILQGIHPRSVGLEIPIRKITIICLLVSALSTRVIAMPSAGMPQNPHTTSQADTGFIDGVLLTADNKPVANQTVTLIIYENQREILTIDKQTDAQGKFKFKNIIKSPQFFYDVGTIYENKMFIYPKIALKENETTIKVDFVIGSHSHNPHKAENTTRTDTMQKLMPKRVEKTFQGSYEVQTKENPATTSLDNPDVPPDHMMSTPGPEWFDPFKMMIFILCGVVILSALYFLFSGQKKSNQPKM
ncbi:MAG: hypothetical protein HQM16_09885 [Deltaproteobacteria bacterium]|nr:hypothetical protein [Deltaproteobacteria bacterium]